MTEFVTIKHPSLPEATPGRVTKRAFERLFSPKGWEVIGDAPATTTINVPSLSITEQRAAASESPVAEAPTEEPATGDSPDTFTGDASTAEPKARARRSAGSEG